MIRKTLLSILYTTFMLGSALASYDVVDDLTVTGNVGIGSSLPKAKLDVNGSVYATTFYGSAAGLTGLPSSMTYPSAGISVSTGSSWGTPITDNSSNWNTAYTDRLKWDGGSSGLTASTGRTSLGLGSIATYNVGTLTDTKYCTYSTSSGFVCNSEGGSGGSSGWTTDSSTKTTTTYNVGIGSSAPSRTLDVVGTEKVSSSLSVGSSENSNSVFEVFATPGAFSYGSNFLTGGTASANNSFNGAASNAVDGSTATLWGTDILAFPHYWKYDLGSGVAKIAKKLRIYLANFRGGHVAMGAFTLQGSNDDSTYTTLLTATVADTINVWQEWTFTSNITGYRYYKIVNTSGNTGQNETSISEVALFEGTSTNSSTLMVNNGNIGIGSTTPTSKLDLVSSGTTSATSAVHVKDSLGNSKFFINDAGNVGVGTSVVSQKLVVNGRVQNIGIGTTLAGTLACFKADGTQGWCSGSVTGNACATCN